MIITETNLTDTIEEDFGQWRQYPPLTPSDHEKTIEIRDTDKDQCPTTSQRILCDPL